MKDADCPPPHGSLSVRIGCSLAYEAVEPAPILLLIQPYPAMSHLLVEEKLIIGTQTPVEHLIDSHGNKVLKTVLLRGTNEIRYEAILQVPNLPDNHGLSLPHTRVALPYEVLRYTLPSRYCESDKLGAFASERFGWCAQGLETAQAISSWTHRNIEYRYGTGDSTLSACDAIARGYGVCRDFAHVMVALCRALDLPARYVAGHMPLFGPASPDPDCDIGIDFHAYVEVYTGGAWHVFDPRYDRPYTGRVKVAHGMDAADAAIATIYGNVWSSRFEVWAHACEPCSPESENVALKTAVDRTG